MSPPSSRRGFRKLPVNRVIPNVVTLMGMAAGMTAIRFAIQERWEPALLAVLVAAFMDGIDGRVARLLRGTSRFGAELDSLSDFLCFGVAPAVLLYLWTTHSMGGPGWALTLGFAVCSALRLARFNTMLDDPNPPPWAVHFFTGVPAPAAAILVLVPVMLHAHFEVEALRHPALVAPVMALVAFLMVSRLPTFSFKRVRLEQRFVLPLLVLVGLLAAFLVSDPWLTLSTLALLYLGSVPVAFMAWRKRVRSAMPQE